MSNGVFNFNFLALVFSEILGGPKFTQRGHMPPGRPLADFFLHKASTLSIFYSTAYCSVFFASGF